MTTVISTPSATPERRLEQMLGHTGIDRAFLADEPIRAARLDDVAGLMLAVRLTSYRALPLSCIAGIELAIDDKPLDLSKARLGLAGVFHPLGTLGALTELSWFILDIGRLFVPYLEHLSPGAHKVTGRLCTVEPYITAGRFAFYNSSTKILSLQAESV
jgi:hypothetical protein